MKRLHTYRISDEELRAELAAKDTVLFMGTDLTWQEVVRQVEQLGFGGSYIVSEVKGDGSLGRIRLRPR